MLAPPGRNPEWPLPADALAASPAARIAALAKTSASNLLRFRKACIAAPFVFACMPLRASRRSGPRTPQTVKRGPTLLVSAGGIAYRLLSSAKSPLATLLARRPPTTRVSHSHRLGFPAAVMWLFVPTASGCSPYPNAYRPPGANQPSRHEREPTLYCVSRPGAPRSTRMAAMSVLTPPDIAADPAADASESAGYA